jgi:hypothetical protein
VTLLAHCMGGAGGSFPVHPVGLVRGLRVWYGRFKGLQLRTSADLYDYLAVHSRQGFRKRHALIACVLCALNSVEGRSM